MTNQLNQQQIMTPNPTLREMSDFLAEHLLGWQPSKVWHDEHGVRHDDGFYGTWWRRGKELGTLHGSKWQPHEDISQCFEYIVPALMKQNWYGVQISFDKVDYGQPDNTWTVYYWEDSNGRTAEAKSGNPAAAIVEASYLAVKGMG